MKQRKDLPVPETYEVGDLCTVRVAEGPDGSKWVCLSDLEEGLGYLPWSSVFRILEEGSERKSFSIRIDAVGHSRHLTFISRDGYTHLVSYLKRRRIAKVSELDAAMREHVFPHIGWSYHHGEPDSPSTSLEAEAPDPSGPAPTFHVVDIPGAGTVGVLTERNSALFAADDLASLLGFGDGVGSLRFLPENELESRRLRDGGDVRDVPVVNEAGFYHAVYNRRSACVLAGDDEGRARCDAISGWVIDEVTPQVRGDGSSSVTREQLAAALEAMLASLGGGNPSRSEPSAIGLPFASATPEAHGSADFEALREKVRGLERDNLELAAQRDFYATRAR